MKNNTKLLYSIGAIGLFLGFPNPFFHVPFLVLLYPASLILLAQKAHKESIAFRYGLITGLLGASCSLYWVSIPLHNVVAMPWVLAIPFSFILGAYIGFYGGIFCLIAKKLKDHNPIVYGIELGLVWYFLELIRASFLTGFPWLTLSAAFVPWTFFIQLSSIVGSYALSGIFVIGISWISICIYKIQNSQHNNVFKFSNKYYGIFAGILLYMGIACWGLYVLYNNPLASKNDKNIIPVVIIEGNIDQNQKWDASLQKSTVEKYLKLSQDALNSLKLSQDALNSLKLSQDALNDLKLSQDALNDLSHKQILIIWPETSMPFYYQNHIIYKKIIHNFAKNNEVLLLFGAPGFAKNNKLQTYDLFNRAYLIDSKGKDRGFYDKKHLVPFGEYIPPLLDFEILKPLLQGMGNFSQGVSLSPLTSDKLALGVLICYESIFPELAQKRVADNANILLNISNDAWFGKSSAAKQHLELSSMRAIEQGRWFIRGTNTGISAILDPFGRTIAEGGLFKGKPLIAYAKIRSEKTIYYSIAIFLPYIFLALFIFIFILSHMLNKKNNK